MAIILGNVSTANHALINSWSFSHTHNPTDDGGTYSDAIILLVSGTKTPVTVTCNGIAMTLAEGYFSSSYGSTYIYYILNQSAGVKSMTISYGSSFEESVSAYAAVTISKCTPTALGNTGTDQDTGGIAVNVGSTVSSFLVSAAAGGATTAAIDMTSLNGTRIHRKTGTGLMQYSVAAVEGIMAAAEFLAQTLAVPTVTIQRSTLNEVWQNQALDLSGNVTDDGNEPITERGFVYNTSGTPTTSDTKIIVSGTTGTFSTDITGLTAGTIYYVRAYATNREGTAYSSQISFRTRDERKPKVIQIDTFKAYS